MQVESVENFDNVIGRYNLIHQPYFDLFSPSLPLVPPVKTIVTIHDVIPLEYPLHYPPGIKGRLGLVWEKTAIRSVSRIITDSYASVKALVKYLHLPHAKIKLVYLAPGDQFRRITDKIRLSSVRNKYHLPRKFVLFMGDINWNKNLPGLVETCLNLKIPLVVIGKSAAEIEKLNLSHKELSHLSPLISHLSDPNLIRLGFVPDEDLAAIFSLAGIYCQPSFAEGFGLPVVQAMACGTPVVCSRTHSLPEFAGEAAVYFDPFSVPDMTQKIKSVMTDSGLRKTLSEAGIIQSSRFTWEQSADHTLQVYREVIKSGLLP